MRKTLTVATGLFEVGMKQYGDRKRKAVLPGWSSKLFALCYENFHLPCVWSFCRASWRKKDIICQGKCTQKGCEANIQASLPHRSNNLHITIKDFDQKIPHDPKKKRRVLPNETKALAENLRGKSAYAFRNEMAATMQDENLPERADLPTMNTYRIIKCRDQYPEERNVFDALNTLKQIHVNCIHKIGYDPFYVMYESPAQTAYYAKERQRGRTIISIDATGPGVISPTSNPKCIFLYLLGVHGKKKKDLVFNMFIWYFNME